MKQDGTDRTQWKICSRIYLYDRVYNFMIPFVDVVYDGDDYEFEISLEPRIRAALDLK